MVLSTNSCAISEHKRYMDDGGKKQITQQHNTDPHIGHNAKHEVRPVNPLILTAVESEKSELRHFCGVLMT